ncbi:RNA polymerase subunit sigma-70 [Campylobacter lari]|uniref:sigma factor-like helix-turn-helix DNA-binding protein n=1 Tax=Campylobacter lari TaxID=201 RepID=UPI001289F2B6|nr:sigma factor-like helix-turn-helix DNA-binding protein [Campylobacter lari]EAL5903051.1 RNA polymerase subunit sigma-70 [Campylobacter lari]EHJ5165695.1 RNA polymerase subunit sigma-70 [Campylobacter lari]MCH3689621.1 RNA polymerase subunit sigma-70 [Campylobacter lari]MCH3717665.1 RNA polymerase subunit sigma-70 [Campylobacter lari]
MTFKKIARELGISRVRVNQIYKSALKKLAHPKNKEKWREIMDTLEALEEQRVKKENLMQGERK